MLKDAVGDETLHKFVERTKECQGTADAVVQDKSKKESFGRFTAFLCMTNSDQCKSGSVMKNSTQQHALGDDQHCKNMRSEP